MTVLQLLSNSLQIDLWAVIVVAVIIVAIVIFAVQRSVRAHRQQVAAGREDLVGKIAEVKTALEPKGTVFVQGEQWTAIIEKGRVDAGDEVIITRVDGLKLYVTKK